MKNILVFLVCVVTANKAIGASTDILHAIMDDDLEKVRSLLDSGIDINGGGKLAATYVLSAPVFWAIDFEHVEMLKLLLMYCPDRTLRKIYPDCKGIKRSDGKSSCTMLGAAYRTADDAIIELTKEYMRDGCRNCLAEEHVVLNITWQLPATIHGNVANVNCSKWRCGNNSTWDKTPDLSSCRRLQNIFRPVNGSASVTAAVNITNLSDNIKGENLLPGDVLVIIEGLRSLKEQHVHQDVVEKEPEALSLSEKYVDALVKVIDKISEEPQLWLYIPMNTVKMSFTFLQENILEMGLMITKHFTSNSVLHYLQDNVDLRVLKMPKNYFKEEQNRLYKHPFFNGTQILLPESLSEKEDPIVVMFNSFHNLHCPINVVPCNPSSLNGTNVIAKAQINSGIIGATIGDESKWFAELNEKVEVKFSHIYDGFTYRLENIVCAWWNTEDKSWSTYGCLLQISTELYSICHCNHLINLALIMDINGLLQKDTDTAQYQAPAWILNIGCSLAIVSLVVCILCFHLLRQARNRKNSAIGTKKYLIRLNMCICLLLAEVVLVLGLNATHNKFLCITVAAILHFSFLAAFTWSAIEAFNLYLVLMKVFEAQISQVHYLVVGYGIPFIPVIATLGITKAKGYGTDKMFWLAPSNIIWTFAASLACIMIINLVAFVMAVRVAWTKRFVGVTVSPSSKTTPKSQVVNKLISSITVFLILGLTWIVGFFYMAKGSESLAVVFTVLNSLHGFGILFFGIIFEKEARRELLTITVKVQLERVTPAVRFSVIDSLKNNGLYDDNNIISEVSTLQPISSDSVDRNRLVHQGNSTVTNLIHTPEVPSSNPFRS